MGKVELRNSNIERENKPVSNGNHIPETETKIAELLEKLFVDRYNAYGEAYLDENTNRMAYKKRESAIHTTLIKTHINGAITIGVYQLNGSRLKWGCLDFDKNTEEDYANAKKLYSEACKLGFNPLFELSGGGEYKCHIWIFSNCEAKDMKLLLEDLCNRAGVKPHEIFPKQEQTSETLPYGNLVKLPLALHLATKRKSTFLNDNFEQVTTTEAIEELLTFHLNNIIEIPEMSAGAVAGTGAVAGAIAGTKSRVNIKPLTKPEKYSDFFRFVLNNELPAGISKEGVTIGTKEAGINNNLLKNLGVWLFQMGNTDEDLKFKIKPVYDERKWSFGDLMGWYNKAKAGDIEDINHGELILWCNNYYLNLKMLLPKTKLDDFYKAESKNNISIQTEQPIRIEKRDNNDSSSFIFDKSQIIQNRVFSSHLLTDNIFGFGFLLPRDEDVHDKKGNIIGKKQVWRPVSINTSEKRLLIYGTSFEKDYKIKFEEVPTEMQLRWELEDIEKYLQNPKHIEIKGKDLFNSIKSQYEYYLYFREPVWYNIHPLWDIDTYFHHLFSAFPILENRGLHGTAKTKTMVVSSYITLNATRIMIDPSESTLFRETENIRPTKYIDEAERLVRWKKDGGVEIDNRVELINASYSRDGVVMRQEKQGDKYITKKYHCYSPTMISSIAGLYGQTESRAITQIHMKAPDTYERGEREPDADKDNIKWQDIRNKCYLFALQNWKLIYNEYLNFQVGLKEDGKEYAIKKRDLQIWKPLLVLAKIIDSKLYKDILLFAEKASRVRRADALSDGTLDYKVLFSLKQCLAVKNKENKIYVDDIRNSYNIHFDSDNKSSGFNKTISSHLDKLGFKDCRDTDSHKGSYFEIDIPIFNSITDQQCPQLSIEIKPDKEKAVDKHESEQQRLE